MTYICKFYLQIEGDREFQIVKRIIGAKGSNLKRIIFQITILKAYFFGNKN